MPRAPTIAHTTRSLRWPTRPSRALAVEHRQWRRRFAMPFHIAPRLRWSYSLYTPLRAYIRHRRETPSQELASYDNEVCCWDVKSEARVGWTEAFSRHRSESLECRCCCGCDPRPFPVGCSRSCHYSGCWRRTRTDLCRKKTEPETFGLPTPWTWRDLAGTLKTGPTSEREATRTLLPKSQRLLRRKRGFYFDYSRKSVTFPKPYCKFKKKKGFDEQLPLLFPHSVGIASRRCGTRHQKGYGSCNYSVLVRRYCSSSKMVGHGRNDD